MKFSMNRSRFAKYLNDVSGAVAGRTTIPILTGIKLLVQNDGILLTGSDTDISIEVFIDQADESNELDIIETGGVVLPATFFKEIIKRLANDEVYIETKEQFQTEIRSGQAEFTIKGLDVNNYPRLPEVDTNDTLEIRTDLLTNIINNTVKSVSDSESRPILKGVHFIIENNTLLAVATDSHRLSQRVVPIEMGPEIADKRFDFVIPGSSLKELTRIISEHDTVTLYVTENQVLFQAENLYFYSRLLEGNYPETTRLIPTESSTKLEVNAASFSQAISRASLLSHEGKNNIVKLSIDSVRVLLSSNSPEIGYVEEEIVYSKNEGEALEISFNPEYIRDALASYGQMDVNIQFTTAVRPFIIVPTEANQGPIDNAFVQLITPIRSFD